MSSTAVLLAATEGVPFGVAIMSLLVIGATAVAVVVFFRNETRRVLVGGRVLYEAHIDPWVRRPRMLDASKLQHHLVRVALQAMDFSVSGRRYLPPQVHVSISPG